ncbi:FAD-dependent monooxygenase [Nocardiopsis xinjiangensis]|uniref:FAD-dependent monooxygenase n=1 Tax=Nocardiopsis xinjiangensis TaxID=124285 RepID=UPI00034ADF5F|nr:FAD-dependent monooxygenase [Nocardiopsis xinjiangensis]
MTAVRTVLVSGASVAGPTLAHWLHRRGMRVTVVEKAPAPRPGGHAVDVRGAAVDVAERMGILGTIREHLTQTSRVHFVGPDGRTRAEISPTMDTGHGRSLEIVRGDLARILREATPADTEYLYGDTVTALEEGPDGVHVTFRHHEPHTFDLVVGSDGLHSTTRTLAFGPEEDFAHYLGALISISTVPNHLGIDREAQLYNTPGLGCGLIHSPRFEGAKAVFLAHETEPGGLDRAPEEDQKDYLRKRFTGAGWESDRLLEELAQAPDFYFDSVTQIHMDRWHRGRIALLGDAGYCPSPMSGQGTTLAMVGAHVLAEELGRHTTPEPALEAYEARMRPYVRANQGIADTGLGFLAPRTRLGLATRNAILRLGPLLTTLSRLDTRVARAAEAIDLDAPAPQDPPRHA